MALTGGGPGFSSDLPAIFMYTFAFKRNQIGLGAASAMMMLLFVMITTSLKTLDDIRGGNLMALPAEIAFEAWAKAWSSACTGVDYDGLKRNFWNSVSFVVHAVLISTLIGAVNGYVFTL